MSVVNQNFLPSKMEKEALRRFTIIPKVIRNRPFYFSLSSNGKMSFFEGSTLFKWQNVILWRKHENSSSPLAGLDWANTIQPMALHLTKYTWDRSGKPGPTVPVREWSLLTCQYSVPCAYPLPSTQEFSQTHKQISLFSQAKLEWPLVRSSGGDRAWEQVQRWVESRESPSGLDQGWWHLLFIFYLGQTVQLIVSSGQFSTRWVENKCRDFRVAGQ